MHSIPAGEDHPHSKVVDGALRLSAPKPGLKMNFQSNQSTRQAWIHAVLIRTCWKSLMFDQVLDPRFTPWSLGWCFMTLWLDVWVIDLILNEAQFVCGFDLEVDHIAGLTGREMMSLTEKYFFECWFPASTCIVLENDDNNIRAHKSLNYALALWCEHRCFSVCWARCLQGWCILWFYCDGFQIRFSCSFLKRTVTINCFKSSAHFSDEGPVYMATLRFECC